MNHLQYYLTKLAEEGSEVAQIALKAQQFGPGEVMPGQPLNNFERCHYELDDLWAIVEEMNEKFRFSYTPNRERMEAKKAKVRKYLGYSIRLGMLEVEAPERERPMDPPGASDPRGLTAPRCDSARELKIRQFLREGDTITHTRCMGYVEEHIFTGYGEGKTSQWLRGRPTRDTTRLGGSKYEIDDISFANVTHINRVPIEVCEYAVEFADRL